VLRCYRDKSLVFVRRFIGVSCNVNSDDFLPAPVCTQ
jgi:hypothetical protein